MPAASRDLEAIDRFGPDGLVIGARVKGAAAVVILPTLNEAGGLARTLDQLPFSQFQNPARRVEVLLIDGGSTDGTLDVARARGIQVLRQTGRGKGDAVLEAIHWVYGLGVPYAVVLDADATYPPDRILPTLNLLEGGADLVIGVRRPVWGPPRDGRDMIHRLGNLIFSFAASTLSRRTILDLCSGFWGVSTVRFAALEIVAARFAIEAELVLKSFARGYTVIQIPVDYRERIGVAKLNAVRDGARILLAIVRFGRPARGPREPSAVAEPLYEQLLSIGVISGAPSALVRFSPADSAEASEVARLLRTRIPGTRVALEPSSGPVVAGAGVAARDGKVPGSEEFIVSLAPTERAIDPTRSGAVTVSIRSERRQLTIELPPEEPADDAPATVSEEAFSRSGAMGVRDHSSRSPRYPPFEVLVSHLKSDEIGRQRTLLEANGFTVTEDVPRMTTRPVAVPAKSA